MRHLSKLFAMAVLALFVVACGTKDQSSDPAAGATGEKVALTFHIMSKCPFGVKVVEAVLPVMEKMGDRVDLKIEYIGKEKDGALTSMHGETEVQGNILQLCAKATGDQKQWLDFLKCQFTGDWRKIPEGWEQCATTAKLDQAKMKACYEGEEGKTLLRASFKASEDARATGSPTIFLAGNEPYRGGRADTSFARALCQKMVEPKAPYCVQVPAPPKVPVTVIADKRCTGRSCDSERFLSFVQNTFEGAEVKKLDWAEPDAQTLFGKTGQQYLPIAIFGKDIEKEEAGFNRLKRRLVKVEGGEDYVYPLGREWDPKAEVCDDGVDNTGDGKVDCDDGTCKEKKVCRQETKNKVDLFVMSQCPYGVKTVDAMADVLKNFNKDSKLFNFELNFIGQEANGQLTSMHGQGEVDENIRQLCAQKHFAKGYKFMDYVFCRNKDYRNPEWEPCAKESGVKADVIKKCFEGQEGKDLLAASFKKAGAVQASGSPTWLLNNRFDMQGRTPESIKAAFCEKNTGVAGCDKTLSNTSEAPAAGGCGAQ
ncbi:MAG: hypothetical protein MUC50_02250 [Myxococcota bacterium]|nr:hypothetical protein [Myxococcota bacterium]